MKRRRRTTISLFAFQDIVTGLCGVMIVFVLLQVVQLAEGRDLAVNQQYEGETSESEKQKLLEEIVRLETELREIRKRSDSVIVRSGEKANEQDVARTKEELTEREKRIAALVSQVHDLETRVKAAKDADAQSRERIREMERTRRLLEQQLADAKNKKGITLIPERGSSRIPIYIVCDAGGLTVYRPFEKDKPSRVLAARTLPMSLVLFLDDIDHTTHLVVLLVRPSGVANMNVAVEALNNGSFKFGRDPLEENVDVVFDAGREQ